MMRLIPLLFFILFANPAVYAIVEESKVALVIGNSAYEVGSLPNAVNDAVLISETLKGLDFEVILVKDADHRSMVSAINQFGERLSKSDVGLFYYAGHAVQQDGANYLLPTKEANNLTKATLEFDSVDMNRVLAQMESAKSAVNIVIMDACRNNPFRSFSRSASRGLAQPNANVRGMYIAYSTAPGEVALDGDSDNSPYTEALAKHITTPGLSINDVFLNVRRDVMASTLNEQVPWENGSLTDHFYFAGEVDPQQEREARLMALELEDLKRQQEEAKNLAEEMATLRQQLIVAQAERQAAIEKLASSNQAYSSSESNFEESPITSQNQALETLLEDSQKLDEERLNETARIEQFALAQQQEALNKFLDGCDAMATKYENTIRPAECYQSVLKDTDPLNKRALEGLASVTSNYQRLIDELISRNSIRSAKKTLSLLDTVSPSLTSNYESKIEQQEKEIERIRVENRKKIRVISTF